MHDYDLVILRKLYYGEVILIHIGKAIIGTQKRLDIILAHCYIPFQGYWLLLDEFNLAPPDVLATLVPLLEGSKTIRHPGWDTTVSVSPSFKIIATQNPPSFSNTGRKRLPPSIQRRVKLVHVPEYTQPEVESILIGLMGKQCPAQRGFNVRVDAGELARIYI